MIRLLPTLTPSELESFLKGRHIYTIVDNSPIFSSADEERMALGLTRRSVIEKVQRVVDQDGDPYIDEFGRYVYISCRLGREGQCDQDLRYEGQPDGELFTLQHTEKHDLSDRKVRNGRTIPA